MHVDNIIVVYNKKAMKDFFGAITGKEMHSMCPNALFVNVDKIRTSKSQLVPTIQKHSKLKRR